MSTTAIVIEHLISGIQAFLWLSLFLLTVFGVDWINLEYLKDYATQLSIAALSIVYPIGILIDEVADCFLKKWSHRIKSTRLQKEGVTAKKEDVSVFLLLQATKDNFLTSYFNNVRMRIRISRSSAFNFFALSVAVITFTILRSSYSWETVLIEIVVGFFLTSLAFWGWYRVTDTFAKQAARAYKTQKLNIS